MLNETKSADFREFLGKSNYYTFPFIAWRTVSTCGKVAKMPKKCVENAAAKSILFRYMKGNVA